MASGFVFWWFWENLEPHASSTFFVFVGFLFAGHRGTDHPKRGSADREHQREHLERDLPKMLQGERPGRSLAARKMLRLQCFLHACKAQQGPCGPDGPALAASAGWLSVSACVPSRPREWLGSACPVLASATVGRMRQGSVSAW